MAPRPPSFTSTRKIQLRRNDPEHALTAPVHHVLPHPSHTATHPWPQNTSHMAPLVNRASVCSPRERDRCHSVTRTGAGRAAGMVRARAWVERHLAAARGAGARMPAHMHAHEGVCCTWAHRHLCAAHSCGKAALAVAHARSHARAGVAAGAPMRRREAQWPGGQHAPLQGRLLHVRQCMWSRVSRFRVT